MAKIPAVAAREFVSGLTLLSRGKVRDTYALTDPNVLLSVVSDRISIFDFVLAVEVPYKGESLTFSNVYWFLELAKGHEVPRQDIIAYGSGIDRFLPYALQGNAALQKRAIVIEKFDMIPIEVIVRGYITGSGWEAYQKTAPHHEVCGHRLPPGLKDGDQLPEPIFTPTTKAAEGHDEHMNVEEVRKRWPMVEPTALNIFRLASRSARERGIIVADTKFEFGFDRNGILGLGDERLTPDASRHWKFDDWTESRTTGTSPKSYDKQFVREWGKTMGIHKRNPLNPADVEYVHSLTVPQDVIEKTTEIYRRLSPKMIAGMSLETFQRTEMGIIG